MVGPLINSPKEKEAFISYKFQNNLKMQEQ